MNIALTVFSINSEDFFFFDLGVKEFSAIKNLVYYNIDQYCDSK